MHPGARSIDDMIFKSPRPGTATDQAYTQMEQCNMLLRQGIAQYCNTLATYDAAKCAYVNRPEIAQLINISYTILESINIFVDKAVHIFQVFYQQSLWK
jgi:hypothetical protein